MTDIVAINPKSLSWSLIEMPATYRFRTWRAVVDNISFYKPFEPLNQCEFEEFFHFGAHCQGYDSGRVVVKNSQKALYNTVVRVNISKDGFWSSK